MKRYLIFIVLLLPTLAFATTNPQYQDLSGTSQMMADSIGDFWTYLFNDVPNLLHKFWAWLIVWYTKAKLYAYLEALKFSWIVGKQILTDLNIMSQITSQIALLPQDVRQALVSMRLFDGLNILFNAYLTRFVFRTLY